MAKSSIIPKHIFHLFIMCKNKFNAHSTSITFLYYSRGPERVSWKKKQNEECYIIHQSQDKIRRCIKSAVVETSRLNHSTRFRRRSYADFINVSGGSLFKMDLRLIHGVLVSKPWLFHKVSKIWPRMAKSYVNMEVKPSNQFSFYIKCDVRGI